MSRHPTRPHNCTMRKSTQYIKVISITIVTWITSVNAYTYTMTGSSSPRPGIKVPSSGLEPVYKFRHGWGWSDPIHSVNDDRCHCNLLVYKLKTSVFSTGGDLKNIFFNFDVILVIIIIFMNLLSIIICCNYFHYKIWD